MITSFLQRADFPVPLSGTGCPPLHVHLMGMQPKMYPWRPELRLGAEVQTEAERRGWSLNRFLTFCVLAVHRLEWLDPDVRKFILEILDQLGHPWTSRDVVNELLRQVARLVRAGKVEPFFVERQRHFQLQLPLTDTE